MYIVERVSSIDNLRGPQWWSTEVSLQLRFNHRTPIHCFNFKQVSGQPRCTATSTTHFCRTKRWNVLDWPGQSSDRKPTDHEFHLLEKGLNPKKVREGPRKRWHSCQSTGPSNATVIPAITGSALPGWVDWISSFIQYDDS